MSAAVVPAAAPGERNLVEMLLARAKDRSGPAARHKTASGWSDVSWPELVSRVRAVSNGLTALGVKPGDRVAVFAATSLTWLVTDLAIAAARAVCVPIYASNTPDEVRFILQDSGAVVLFVDDDVADARQAGRLTRARAKLREAPDCRAVVLFSGTATAPAELTLESLVAKGAEGRDDFDARVAGIAPDDLCHLIYTSGTTGDPKGVMLTHGNWGFEANAIRALGVMKPEDALMLFLPLAHSFAQVVKASWVALGFTLIIAESVEKVVANLAETSPTIFPAVPRVFEKVYASVQSNALSAPGLKGALGRWAFGLFDEYAAAREAGRPTGSLGFSLARALVFDKVRSALEQKLGGRLRLFVSGGAPLPRKVGYFFELCGFSVCEGYGLTETTAGSTINVPGDIRIGTVGRAFPGVELAIAKDGEILVRGPNVMKGYFRNEAATAEVLRSDGFFQTGDIGTVDADGFVRITDRKKDLIKTSGGKYCAPQNLENALKTFPIVSNSMVHGDRRPYLVVLIAVNEEHARKLLADVGVTVGTTTEVLKRPEVVGAVKAAIDAVNADLPPYSTLKRFFIVPRDFSQETGELTPTLKVKRKVVTASYQAELAALYADAWE
ncbi:MAG: long-chain fatty acid--CoA ligase [Myxococcaceae bacterium]|nr:long-chain fatty acid--CoA ligase [Myxococcaceae bacterium]